MKLLERLLQAAEDGGRMGSAIEILLLQALAHDAQGGTSSALAALERALALAEPEGYVRLFVEEGHADDPPPPRSPLARDHTGLYSSLIKQHSPAVVQNRLIWLELTLHFEPRTLELIEPLSPRELEVLQLIAQGLSNREISERLFITISTVKGHNRRIFGKLAVQRRTEAVARAGELGLIIDHVSAVKSIPLTA